MLLSQFVEDNAYTYDFKTFGPIPLGPKGSFKNVRYCMINDENEDHLFIYFQNNTNGK